MSMSHIAFLRNSSNKWTISSKIWFYRNIRRIQNLVSYLRIEIALFFAKAWVLFPVGCFVPSFVEFGTVALKKIIFKFRQCIFSISLSSSLGNGRVTSCEQTWKYNVKILSFNKWFNIYFLVIVVISGIHFWSSCQKLSDVIFSYILVH